MSSVYPSVPNGSPGLPTTQPLPLEDIITPNAIDAWPPAIGWWLLAVLTIGLFTFGLFLYHHHQKKWGYRKEGLKLLNRYLEEWKSNQLSTELCCQHFLATLKRSALTAYPHAPVGSLYGNKWLELLQKQAPKVACAKSIQELICYGQYQKSASLAAEQLYHYCYQWIRQHNRQWYGAVTDV